MHGEKTAGAYHCESICEDGGEVDVDTLTPEQKRAFATQMKITYLNALFRGQAVFRRAEEGAEA